MDDKSNVGHSNLRRRRAIAVDDETTSRLKLAHLRLVAALADTGMVSAAAKAVGMTQPAASRRIAELEALLDAPLCDRLSRGVRLTPLGHALARHARSVLLHLAQAEREFADLRAGRRGAVAIGAVSGPAVEIAAPAMARVRAEAPGVEVDIRIDVSNRAGARAARVAARLHHRPRARRPRPAGVREPGDRRRRGACRRQTRPSAARTWTGDARRHERL